MSEGAGGKFDPRTAALVKEVQALKKEVTDLSRWRPSSEKGVQTALKESREAVRRAGQNPVPSGATWPGGRAEDWPLHWPIANPRGTRLIVSPGFHHDLKVSEKDGSLREEFSKKVGAVLLSPESYGKPLSGARKGQRSVRVADNYRLVWSVAGDAVRLELFCRKEDRRYSPFGA